MNRPIQWVGLLIFFLGSPLLASSDPDREVAEGKHIYTQCIGCHSPGYHRTGPKHCGLLGRRAGSVSGFEFTSEMKASGIMWTTATLDEFLKAPLTMIPGTSMGFAGIPSDRERAQLIAFLATLTEKNALCR